MLARCGSPLRNVGRSDAGTRHLKGSESGLLSLSGGNYVYRKRRARSSGQCLGVSLGM